MSVSAIILNSDHPSAHEKVYGLFVLERTFHALERAGVEAVILPEQQQEKLLTLIGRNKNWKLKFSFISDLQKAFPTAIEGLLLIEAPMVIDQKIPQNLIGEGTRFETEIVVSKNKQAAFFSPSFLKQKQSIPESIVEWIAVAEKENFAIKEIDFSNLICSTVYNRLEKKKVKKALIKSLTKPTDGWVSRNLNRPISTSISRVLAHTSITPNQFTVFTGLIGISTGFFLAKGGYWNYLIGGALFHLTSVLDGVDGELARLKFKSSPFGQWLDTLVDNLSYLAALAGIIIGLFMNGASDVVKLAGILAVVFAVLALASLYLFLIRFNSGGTLLNVEYNFQGGKGFFDRFMQVAAAFGKRDLFALLFFILGIIGQMPMALGYVAIMAFFVFVFSIQAHLTAGKNKKIMAK